MTTPTAGCNWVPYKLSTTKINNLGRLLMAAGDLAYDVDGNVLE